MLQEGAKASIDDFGRDFNAKRKRSEQHSHIRPIIRRFARQLHVEELEAMRPDDPFGRGPDL